MPFGDENYGDEGASGFAGGVGNPFSLNPLNPSSEYYHKVPKVESSADLKARHKNLDDAQAKAQKDYTDAMDKSHAMVASGTNYSHEDLHDLAMRAADARRMAAHLRALRAQLPPLPKVAVGTQTGSTNQTTGDALDALAKAKMAEKGK